MNIRFTLISVFIAFAVSGCGKKDAATAGSTPAAGATAVAAAPKAGAAPRVIEITANDQMKFSVTTIEAKPGEQLKVVLTNIGAIPVEAMGHNWVLLKAGTDVAGFSAAAAVAKDTGYISPALKDQVIANTAVLGPRKSDEVTFTAPAAGEYPFLCSFPGHFITMKGTLIVK